MVLRVRREREGQEVREEWMGGRRRGESGVVGGPGIAGMWGLAVGLGVSCAE